VDEDRCPSSGPSIKKDFLRTETKKHHLKGEPRLQLEAEKHIKATAKRTRFPRSPIGGVAEKLPFYCEPKKPLLPSPWEPLAWKAEIKVFNSGSVKNKVAACKRTGSPAPNNKTSETVAGTLQEKDRISRCAKEKNLHIEKGVPDRGTSERADGPLWTGGGRREERDQHFQNAVQRPEGVLRGKRALPTDRVLQVMFEKTARWGKTRSFSPFRGGGEIFRIHEGYRDIEGRVPYIEKNFGINLSIRLPGASGKIELF